MWNNLVKVIAEAIRETDKSFFSEDYGLQAKEALKAVESAGYIIMPKELSEEIITTTKNTITYGRTNPTELIKDIYHKIQLAYLKTKK